MGEAAEARVGTPAGMPGGDPEYAARLGVVAARPGVRAWAFTIDLLIAAALASPAAIGGILVAGGDLSWGPLVLLAVGVGAPVVFGVVQLVLHGRRGVTAGKAAMRLRSVSLADLGRPGVWRIGVRALVLGASGVVPLLGPAVLFASGLGDPRGRSILDRVGGCWLVDVRAGIDPGDARAVRRAIRELEMPLREVSEGLASLATVPRGERPTLADRRSRAAIVGIAGGPWSQPPAADAGGLVTEVPRIASHLVFEDGSSVPVPVYGLIGRMPEAAPGRSADLLLTLEDPQRMLSKTHLAFGADAGSTWVMDLASSNGTTVVGPTGVETAIVPGSRVALAPGAVVRVGGRMFQVRQGGAQA